MFFALNWGVSSPGSRRIQAAEALAVRWLHPNELLHRTQTGRHGSRIYSVGQGVAGGKHQRCKICEKFGVRIASVWGMRARGKGVRLHARPRIALPFYNVDKKQSRQYHHISLSPKIAYHDHVSHDVAHTRSSLASARFSNCILVRIDAKSCAAWRDEGKLRRLTACYHFLSTVTYTRSPRRRRDSILRKPPHSIRN
jgi:hypothetical protein